MKCKHAVHPEENYVCLECWREDFKQFNSEHVDSTRKDGKIPIYAGCPNSGHGCFCTGACKRIVGYREPHPLENVL